MPLYSEPDEAQSELFKFKIALAIVLLFILSGIASCHELRYLAFGKTTQAQCDRVETITLRGRRGSVSHELGVHYSFTDSSLGPRKETDNVSLGWGNTAKPGAPIAVQYIPGVPERSRLKGHNYVWLTIPFALCTLALAGFSIYFWRDYQAHQRRVRRSERR